MSSATVYNAIKDLQDRVKKLEGLIDLYVMIDPDDAVEEVSILDKLKETVNAKSFKHKKQRKSN